jgi:chromosome segregation and condensation protein ScpB
VADEILESLRAVAPDGMTRTEISGLFGRNQPARRITAVLRDLEARRLILKEKGEHEGPGRPPEYWYAAG